MDRLTMCGAAAVMAVLVNPAAAQVTKTITGETKNLTVSVEAIDHANRQVTGKKPDGTYEVFYVPTSVRRFDTLKIGDKVTAKYYENMVLQLKAPGDKAVNSGAAGTVRAESGTAGTVSHQRTITATITAIDPNVPSITFTGPQDWKYSSRVKDKEALAKVKVGDKVDITWTEALILSLDEAK
jgi:Cu/Ag efflux protein CusF